MLLNIFLSDEPAIVMFVLLRLANVERPAGGSFEDRRNVTHFCITYDFIQMLMLNFFSNTIRNFNIWWCFCLSNIPLIRFSSDFAQEWVILILPNDLSLSKLTLAAENTIFLQMWYTNSLGLEMLKLIGNICIYKSYLTKNHWLNLLALDKDSSWEIVAGSVCCSSFLFFSFSITATLKKRHFSEWGYFIFCDLTLLNDIRFSLIFK